MDINSARGPEDPGPAQPTAMRALVAQHAPALAVVALVASIPRIYEIGSRALWLDEAHTYTRASLPISDLITHAINNLHTPTYFIGIHYWIKLAGTSEAALRVPSAAFGVLTVMLTYCAGAILGGRFLGLAAALMLAVCPEHVHYGQEARMYTMITSGAAALMAAHLWIALHPETAALSWYKPSSKGLAGAASARLAWFTLAAGCFVCLWTHNLGALVVLASIGAGIATLVHHRQASLGLLRGALVAYGLVGAGWVWWLPILSSQQSQATRQNWGELSWEHLYRVGTRLYCFNSRQGWPEVALCVIALAGFWFLRRRAAAASVLASFALLAPLVVIAVSVKHPLLAPRLLLWVTIPMVLLLATTIASVPSVWARWALLAAFVGWAGGVQLPGYFARRSKPAWRDVATLITREDPKQSAIFYAPHRTAMDPLFYYLDTLEGGSAVEPIAVNASKVRRAARRKRWIWLVMADREDTPRSAKRRAIIEHYATLSWSRTFGRKFHLYKYYVTRDDH